MALSGCSSGPWFCRGRLAGWGHHWFWSSAHLGPHPPGQSSVAALPPACKGPGPHISQQKQLREGGWLGMFSCPSPPCLGCLFPKWGGGTAMPPPCQAPWSQAPRLTPAGSQEPHSWPEKPHSPQGSGPRALAPHSHGPGPPRNGARWSHCSHLPVSLTHGGDHSPSLGLLASLPGALVPRHAVPWGGGGGAGLSRGGRCRSRRHLGS